MTTLSRRALLRSAAAGTALALQPDWLPMPAQIATRYPDAAAFATMLKSGKRPDGSAVSTVMPFVSLREMSEVDVRALYLHLTTMPAPR